MKCSLQVQNHLYVCTVVEELLKGIPLNILDIGIRVSNHLYSKSIQIRRGTTGESEGAMAPPTIILEGP